MTILSNVDIEKEIGLSIAIYPFYKQNLRGANYNLTVSKLAWNLETKQSIYDLNTNKITIAKGSTALIQTNEAVWVSSRIAGTYHSKVALVSKGLSHIGTTLDPEYIGVSLITVHNYGSEDIILSAEKDTFVTLMFYYVATEASIQQGSNLPGKREVLQGFTVTPDENNWLDEDFRNIPSQLKNKLNECPDFKVVIKKRKLESEKIKTEEERKLEFERKQRRSTIKYTSSLFVFFLLMVVLLYLSFNKDKLVKTSWYDLAVNSVYTVLFVIPASLLAKAFNDLK